MQDAGVAAQAHVVCLACMHGTYLLSRQLGWRGVGCLTAAEYLDCTHLGRCSERTSGGDVCLAR